MRPVKIKITSMDEKKSDILTVRLTPSVKKALEKRAKEGFRTLSQEVEMIITKALDKDKKRWFVFIR